LITGGIKLKKKESEAHLLKIDLKLSCLDTIVKRLNSTFYSIEVKQSHGYNGSPKSREFEIVIQGYIDSYAIQQLKQNGFETVDIYAKDAGKLVILVEEVPIGNRFDRQKRKLKKEGSKE
jgi:hypothetical protein